MLTETGSLINGPLKNVISNNWHSIIVELLLKCQRANFARVHRRNVTVIEPQDVEVSGFLLSAVR